LEVVFLCLDEALTEAIYSFGGDVGRSGNPGTTWRVYTWENTRPGKLSHNELENGCFNGWVAYFNGCLNGTNGTMEPYHIPSGYDIAMG